MNGAKVYVVEVPMRYNRDRRVMEPARSVADAARFGEVLEPLLPPAMEGELDTAALVGRLSQGLEGFTERDYLVAGMGHPLALAAATVIASAKAGGRLKVLHWLRDEGAYKQEVIDTRTNVRERYA